MMSVAATKGSTAHLLLTKYNIAHDDHISRLRLDDAWLAKRLFLFRKWLLPSVINQSRAPDRWLVLMDGQTPHDRLDELKVDLPECAEIVLAREPLNDLKTAALIARYVPPRTNTLITTRVDSDDAMARDYLQRVFECSANWRGFINAPSGFRISDTALVRCRDHTGPFLSFVEDIAGNRCPLTVFQGPHHLIARQQPVLQLRGAGAWLQVIHGANLANTLSGFPTRPAAARRALGSHAPFASDIAVHGAPFILLLTSACRQLLHQASWHLRPGHGR